jgi:hypothetical protein
MPLGLLSTAKPEAVVERLVAVVDERWNRIVHDDQAEPDVILVGHSFGAVLARQLYCRAWGAGPDATIDPSRARPWAGRIRRIILLAGMNRGWTTTSAVGPIQRLLMRLGAAVGHTLALFGREPIAFAVRRGAPFLTTMRLQWLELAQDFPHGAKLPLTVQLLGTRDDLVSPADNVDLATGGGFLYLEIPGSGHADMIEMGERWWSGAACRTACFAPSCSARRRPPGRAVRRWCFNSPHGEPDVLEGQRSDRPTWTTSCSSRPTASTSAEARPPRTARCLRHPRNPRPGYWTERSLAPSRSEPGKGIGCSVIGLRCALCPSFFPGAPREGGWLLDRTWRQPSVRPARRFSYVGAANLLRAPRACPA